MYIVSANWRDCNKVTSLEMLITYKGVDRTIIITILYNITYIYMYVCGVFEWMW